MTAPLPPNVTPINQAAVSQAATAQAAAAAAAANSAAWNTQSAGYDPDKFFTAARNSATNPNPGAFEFVKIKVPTWIHVQLQSMVNSNEIPSYDSPDDAVRDALYHRFHYLGDRKGSADFRRKIKDFVEQIQHEQAVTSAELNWQKLNDLLARSKEMFERYAADEGWKMLHDMIETHRQYIDAWDDCLTKKQLLDLCDEYEKRIPADILF